jgi:glycosyltransferase involved in cell wall biosynthesis
MSGRRDAVGNDLPLVTIVTPSYNQGEYIEATIRSVLEQDYPRIEYLVIDGGSSDKTLEILGRQSSRVRWISEPDNGQGDAIRKGFGIAQGEIVAWLNSDDVYLPGAVSRAVAALRQSPSVPLVYGNAEFIDHAGTVLGPCEQVEPFDLGRLINDLDFIVQPATFFRREPYSAVGGLDSSLTYCLDYDLWIRMTQRGGAAFIPDVLAQVRVYPQTKTARGGMARLDEVERMIRRYGRKTLPTEFEREMVGKLRRQAQGAIARGHLKTGAVDVWRGGHYAMRLARRRGFRWVVRTAVRRLTRRRGGSPRA